jgi:uncharacterized glyoxalase superfamily protein PhnB
LLQNFQGVAENFMVSLLVENADSWWERFERIDLKEMYPGIMAQPPTMQPWGLRVLYVSDPNGILWHIAHQRQG